jgi:peptidylprolyl isomerase
MSTVDRFPVTAARALRGSRPTGWTQIVGAMTRRPTRARVLPALGLTLGLAVAAVGVFSKPPQVLTQVPPGYVAVVNQKGLLMSDLIAEIEATGTPFAEATAEQKSTVLRNMIEEELRVQRAIALDIPETTIEVRQALAESVIDQAAAPLLGIQPTEAELRAYYDANRANYTTDGTMLAHDLVLRFGGFQYADQTETQARSDAETAAYQLRAGASIDYIQEHFGFVESGRTNHIEEPDFAAKLHLGDALYKVANTMRDGDVSDPIAADDGVHLLVMDKRIPPSVGDFTVVRSKVYQDYRKEQIVIAGRENLKLLRNQATILVAPGYSE